MPETLLPIISDGVPPGLCYTTLSADIPIMVQYMFARLSGNEINTGSSTPAAEDRDKPWFRTNSDGTDDGWWTFYNGFWIQKHPSPVGLVAMYEGAAADIETFDGGEAGVITNITGAFWEPVTEMAARSPMHPGTLESGTVVNIGDNIGQEKIVMAIGNLIEHTHDITTFTSGATGGDGGKILNEPDPGTEGVVATEPTGEAEPEGMDNIQPTRAIWFIRRTGRLYRRRNA